jgi:uncharacterized protein with HEPN domain
MYEKDAKRLKFLLEKIEDIFDYQSRYTTTELLLQDKMGWDAVTMCIQQIGEVVKHKLSEEFLKNFSGRLPIQEAYWTRNYIVHDYENIDKTIISSIIQAELPKIKKEIAAILVEIASS